MIDIKPYIDKLDVLKEYMDVRVDSIECWTIWMDLQVCETEYYIKNKLPIPKPYPKLIHVYTCSRFKEYYELQNKN